MSGADVCLVMTPSEAGASVPGWGDDWLVVARDDKGRIRMLAVPAEDAALRLPGIIGERAVFPALPGYRRADLPFAEERIFVEHVERHARPRPLAPSARRAARKSKVKTTAVRGPGEAVLWAAGGFVAGMTGVAAVLFLL